MSIKKDKQKVLGEVFDDERVKSFLDYIPYGDINQDYAVLERAYRGMVEENFATFVQFFVEAGRDLHAKNNQGLSFTQVIAEHRHAGPYLAAIKAHTK